MCSFATTHVEKLHIHTGTLTTVNDTFAYWSLSQQNAFNQESAVLSYPTGDTLDLWIVNHHTASHQFKIEGTAVVSTAIMPGDSQLLQVPLISEGIFKIRATNSNAYYMGLAGIIHSYKKAVANYYWQLREHQGIYNDSLHNGNQFNINAFKPECFTINGINYPKTKTDSGVYITGNVGDTIYLHIVNNGLMSHSIHCHGYHMTILASNVHPDHIGRVKDSFPVEPGGYISLLLVPDKPGLYPVHDHNLVAVTGGGNYPGGMISFINIGP